MGEERAWKLGLRYEVKESQQDPSKGRPRQVTVGHVVDVIGDVDVELELIRETAIERPRGGAIQHTGGQNRRNCGLAILVGEEAVLTAVLSTKRSCGNHGVVRPRRRIETRRLENRNPNGVLSIRDQSREMDDDMRSLFDALYLCLPVGLRPFTPSHLMAIRRRNRSQRTVGPRSFVVEQRVRTGRGVSTSVTDLDEDADV